MSLLLEALKKAELAKRSASPDGAAAASAPEATPETATPVMTRERLPDISQPLEILTDDLPSSKQKPVPAPAARRELALQDQEPPAAVPQPVVAEEPARSNERTQAEQLFRLNEVDYNPRRPFYLTLAVLAMVGIGYGGYVWWQLRPKSSFSTQVVAARPVSAPASSSAGVAAAGPSAPIPAVPVLPDRPTQSTQAGRPVPRAGQAPAVPTITPAPSGPAFRRERIAETGNVPGAGEAQKSPPIAVKPSAVAIDPLLEQAYAAYEKGDLPGARDSYLRLLAREPGNRDALLGMAAIDVRTGNPEGAASRYAKLLEMDPRDAQAVSGLAALRGQVDPAAAESRLKNLIASQPGAGQLYFALGNLYAQQSRWSEAQEAYFRGYSAEPENADYAFNLAVSLDQLRQPKPALEYYRRALALSDKRPASFDRARVQARVQELSR